MPKNRLQVLSVALAGMLGPVLMLAVAGCGGGSVEPSGPPVVVATTGMIADAASRIGGDRIRVEALMGPGVDPHLYKPSEGDVRRLGGADLILLNGLHLEGKMGDILEKMGRSRPVVAVAEAIPVEDRIVYGEGLYDPHVWFDPLLWSRIGEPIGEALAGILPGDAGRLRAEATAFRREMEELHAWVQSRLEELPQERRVLVTAHDAFGYFGRRYGVEVVGLQGISTIAEAGLRDVERLTDMIVERRIPAIFVESSVPRRSIEAVQAACRARGHEVAIGGQLFSDSMGASGTPEGTYPGMVRYNVNTIVEALR